MEDPVRWRGIMRGDRGDGRGDAKRVGKGDARKGLSGGIKYSQKGEVSTNDGWPS